MKRLIYSICVLCVTVMTFHQALGGNARLDWNASSSSDVEFYRIYMGADSGNYYQHLNVGKSLYYTFYGLSDDTTYYFAVTAIDSAGYESSYSNEVSISFEDVSSPDTTYWEGDLDKDGDVDNQDKAILQSIWYTESATMNLVGANMINAYDLAKFARNHGKTGYKSITQGGQ